MNFCYYYQICPHYDKELNLKSCILTRNPIRATISPKPIDTSSLSQDESLEIINPPEIFDTETNTKIDSMDIDMLLECDQQEDHNTISDHSNDPLPTHSRCVIPTESDVEPQPNIRTLSFGL